MNQPNTDTKRMLELLALGFILLTGVAYFYTARFEDFLGTTIILFAAVLPAGLWINSRSGGIPIFPTAAVLYWIYYGLPTFRGVGERDGYSPQHVLDTDLAVALFLFVATAAWFRFLRPLAIAKPKAAISQAINSRAILTLVTIGLGSGMLFYLFLYSSYSSVFGSATGILRAVLTAPLLLACYFLGYGRAKSMFSTVQWIAALAALTFTLVLQVGGLELIVCVTEIGAALLGYIYTARRVPWIWVLLFAVLVSVFQAGKAVIRDRYANVDITAAMTPELVSKWFAIGFDAMQNGSSKGQQSVSERASLLDQLIRVMVLTPDRVPYLNGETYTYLPSMIVPRVLNPNRAPTQVVMSLLDVRYGFLTREATRKTAVGVNIIPEAFANFGYVGICLIAITFGSFTGYLARISAGREATSLPTLLAIAAMVTVIDMEADLSYLFTTFFQSAIAITVFYYGLRFTFGNQSAGKLQRIS